jgi:hypothetical protein
MQDHEIICKVEEKSNIKKSAEEIQHEKIDTPLIDGKNWPNFIILFIILYFIFIYLFIYFVEIPDVFTVDVGLVPPNATVIIKLKYVSELPVEGDDVSLYMFILFSYYLCFSSIDSLYICFVFPSYMTPTQETISKGPADPSLGFSIQVIS